MEVLIIKPPYMQLSKPDYRVPKSLLRGVNYLSPAVLIQANTFYLHNVPCKICVIEDVSSLGEIIKSLNDTILVGISCTCAWEYLETLYIAQEIKQFKPTVKIAVGGWQIKSIGQLVFYDCKYIDYAITDDNDDSLYELYCKLKNGVKVCNQIIIHKVNNKSRQIQSSCYNYELYPNYRRYLPFIEESRGCPNHCSFCLNSTCGTGYYKKCVEKFACDIQNVEKFYSETSEVILLAANFGVNAKDTKAKLTIMKQHKLLWNLEMYVDNPWESYVNELYSAGIRKISIGLESCSIETLKKMNKTYDPDRYLRRSIELLYNLKKQNIRTTVNILIHYTDTKETLFDTISFLLKYKQYIDRVRFNHMYYFYGLNDSKVEKKFMICSKYNDLLHVIPLCPSWICLDELIDLFINIEDVYNRP